MWKYGTFFPKQSPYVTTKVFNGAKWSREQSVLSKMCQGIECDEEQNNMGSKVCVSPQHPSLLKIVSLTYIFQVYLNIIYFL